MILMNSPDASPNSKILILSWLTLVLRTSRAHTVLVFLLFDIVINYTSHMGNKGIERTDDWILRSESLMTKIHMGRQKEVIDHFDSQKIDIKTPLNQTGDTLAHFAAYKGHYKILEYLRQKGDNFDTLNTVQYEQYRETQVPLMWHCLELDKNYIHLGVDENCSNKWNNQCGKYFSEQIQRISCFSCNKYVICNFYRKYGNQKSLIVLLQAVQCSCHNRLIQPLFKAPITSSCDCVLHLYYSEQIEISPYMRIYKKLVSLDCHPIKRDPYKY